MGNLKNTIPKHILKKKTKKTINLDHNYKKKQKSMRERERERERERILTVFLWGKYELNERNDIEFIQNQMGRRRVKF